jgi:hypothetical protein
MPYVQPVLQHGRTKKRDSHGMILEFYNIDPCQLLSSVDPDLVENG